MHSTIEYERCCCFSNTMEILYILFSTGAVDECIFTPRAASDTTFRRRSHRQHPCCYCNSSKNTVTTPKVEQRSHSLKNTRVHTHTPGNGRLCWASSCRLPSLRSYPGLAEACCCHLSQATLEDRNTERRQERNIISQFLSKFGKEYARHGAAVLCLCHDPWKCSWAINQIRSAGCAAFWKQ